jgi:hypothetical protein
MGWRVTECVAAAAAGGVDREVEMRWPSTQLRWPNGEGSPMEMERLFQGGRGGHGPPPSGASSSSGGPAWKAAAPGEEMWSL